MAQVAEFEVLHPVRHNGSVHAQGAKLRLTASEGSRLVKMQVVRLNGGAAPIEVDDEVQVDRAAFLADIEKATKAQLIKFASDSYGLTVTGNKEELVAAILNAEAKAIK